MVSRDTVFAVHSPIDAIGKHVWLSHYGIKGKEHIGSFLSTTGAYHSHGKNECIRLMTYSNDFKYMVLAHNEYMPNDFMLEARNSGADIVICGRHVFMDLEKVTRLEPPWFGLDWHTSFDSLVEKAKAAGLSVLLLETKLPEKNDLLEDAYIDFGETAGRNVDILVPCSWDIVPMKFWVSMVLMDMSNVRRILVCGDEDICSSRNKLVQEFLEGPCEHAMFFDTDMSFPQDTVNRLLSRGKDIVAGVYYQRQFPYYPHAYKNLGSTEYPRNKRIVEFDTPLTEVDGAGTGCMMIKREVFEKRQDGKWFGLRFVPIDSIVGEDIDFCLNAKKDGYKIFVDNTLDITHQGIIQVNPAEAVKYKEYWRKA